MDLRIEEIGADRLSEYAQIPMKFEVRSIFVVEEIEGGLGGLRFKEEKLQKPYVKDYDSYEDIYADESKEGGCGPESWPRHFDISNWYIFMAFDGDEPVGAAAVAFNTDGVHMLEGRDDIAVLWDIRVHPDHSGKGVGTFMFDHAADWARKKECRQLKIETQNVNVPACRFYVKQGAHIGEINRYGYFSHPRVWFETMLIWYLDL